jgi:hypothetical protein
VAEGNGRYSASDQRRFIEMAAGATVKTAAYLDIYKQKLLSQKPGIIWSGRELLDRILAMLSGWSR